MMSNNSFHPIPPVIEMGKEATLLIEITQLMKDIYLPFLGEGISDFFFEEPTRSHRDSELGQSSAELC